jgi:hypothetical protein
MKDLPDYGVAPDLAPDLATDCGRGKPRHGVLPTPKAAALIKPAGTDTAKGGFVFGAVSWGNGIGSRLGLGGRVSLIGLC